MSHPRARTAKLITGVDDEEEEEEELLDVHSIDAHWLQRGLSGFYSDARPSGVLAGSLAVVKNLSPRFGLRVW